MSESIVTERQSMSFEDYLALPDEIRAEYVDGVALMTPPPSYAHQKICQRLTRLLEDALSPALDVVAGTGWQYADGVRVRIPDLMVLVRPPAGPRVIEPPLVALEVLSGNRSDDLVRKSAEYLEAGVAQYWVIDPRDRSIDVAVSADGRWRLVARLTESSPSAVVDVADTAVGLDLSAILA